MFIEKPLGYNIRCFNRLCQKHNQIQLLLVVAEFIDAVILFK